MQKTNKKNILTSVSLLLLVLVIFALDNLPNVSPMLLTVLKKGSVYALVAVSMNLLNGFTGLFSLGQAGFMLVGAYTYAALTIPVDQQVTVYQRYENGGLGFSLAEIIPGSAGTAIGVVVAILLGGLLAAILAYLIGLPVLKLKSDYLAIATLGFAEIVRSIVQYDKLGPITNGSNLLYGFPNYNDCYLDIGGTTIKFGTVAPFVMSGVCIFIIVLLINSTYGRAFKAIRDDEIAAEAMGINLAHHKKIAFAVSSFFAGVSGGLLAMYQACAQATAFKVAMTYEILLIVVIGGIGSVSGSVIAAFLYVFSSEWGLRGLDEGTFLGISAPGIMRQGFRMVVFSVIIMVIVLFFRRGLMGDRELPAVIAGWKARLKKKTGDRKAGAAK